MAILIFNAIYSFLSSNIQNKPQIRYCAIAAAIIILVYGVYQIIQKQQNKIYAHVSVEGKILKSKNFPWTITIHNKDKEGAIIYILDERYGDASLVSIKLDKPNAENKKYKTYNAIDGVGIKFFCGKKNLSSFWIYIKNL
ncbi:MAG: hypothetical protein K9M01_02940 [Candidatus Omnitrophica bacterium]|nr:hypothetical protein [Candidatus Omnitrophota bacterium]